MIRARTALTERSRGVFYRKREPFLHFHEDPAGFFCDMKIDGRFRRHPATTKAQQRTLVARVVRLATNIPLPHRGRGPQFEPKRSLRAMRRGLNEEGAR